MGPPRRLSKGPGGRRGAGGGLLVGGWRGSSRWCVRDDGGVWVGWGGGWGGGGGVGGGVGGGGGVGVGWGVGWGWGGGWWGCGAGWWGVVGVVVGCQSVFGTITSTHFSGKPHEPHETSQPKATTQIRPLRPPYIKQIRLHTHTQLVKKLTYAEAVLRTQLFRVICMFVVVNLDALAHASDIQIEMRQVVFLC